MVAPYIKAEEKSSRPPPHLTLLIFGAFCGDKPGKQQKPGAGLIASCVILKQRLISDLWGPVCMKGYYSSHRYPACPAYPQGQTVLW